MVELRCSAKMSDPNVCREEEGVKIIIIIIILLLLLLLI
jgi:hypothetical protein